MSDPYTPGAGKNIVSPGGNKEGTLSQSDISRILPRQISTGTMRGTQIVTGVFQMNDTLNVPRMIIDAPNSVIKISRPNINVSTASDSQLIFNSNQNIFKIVGSVSFNEVTYTTVTATAGQVALDVAQFSKPHGLGFAPAIVGYIPDSSGNYFELPRTSWAFAGDNIGYSQVISQVYANSTNIVWQISTFLSAIGSASSLSANVDVGPVKVYFLQETAS